MPLAVLTLWKLVLLGLLYLFLARVVRVVMADLYGPSRRSAPAKRPTVTTAPTTRKVRRHPRGIRCWIHLPDADRQLPGASR